MVELVIATYGGLCYLLFVRFKVIKVNTYSVMTAILGGILILVTLWGMLAVCHPSSSDARLYATVVPIVAEVRGRVIEVPIEENQPIAAGDVLFRIDPRPYEIEVDRLTAVLATKNTRLAQLTEELAGAEAVVRRNRAEVLAAESENERQLRLKVESAKATVSRIEERLAFAKTQFGRAEKLLPSRAITPQEFERIESNLNALNADLIVAKTDQARFEEELTAGSASVLANREELKRANAAAERIRIELLSESDGVNPQIRETKALLDQARLNLERCEVRATTAGRVPQLTLKPGQMATTLPLKPLLAFVPDGPPYLVASFPQSVLQNVKPGQEAEIAFEARPGRVFKTRVRYRMPMIREGELATAGSLLSTAPNMNPSQVPVVFEFDEVIANENLPTGSAGTIAIYTDRIHALSMVRKIVLRIRSWENYLFFLRLPGH